MKNRFGLSALMIAATLIVSACGSKEAAVATSTSTPLPSTASATGINIPAPEKTKVTLRLNWKFKGEFTPFFITKEKGIFEKYGLDVDVLEGTSSVQTMQVISQNKDDVGVTSTVEPMQGIEKGMPVKVIASYMARSPIIILSHPDNPIQSPKDLEGKKLAASTSSTFTSVYEKFLQHNKVDAGKVQLIKLETGARNALFLNKEVDGVAVFSTNELPMFEKKLNMKLVPMYMADYGFDISGLTLIAGNKFLESNPNTAKRLLAAIDEGFRYTVANPEESAKIIKGIFPDTVDEALTVEQIIRTGELAVFKDNPYGWVNNVNIEATAKVLQESGLIEQKLDTANYFTNEYFTR
jgi:ABC-type nitrate/sulfonate/bicarbonate transport system substrate-binding protein